MRPRPPSDNYSKALALEAVMRLFDARDRLANSAGGYVDMGLEETAVALSGLAQDLDGMIDEIEKLLGLAH